MRIAVVVGQFPKLSETFIVSQITGLLDRGHDVRIFARRRTTERSHAQIEEYKLLARTTFYGEGPRSSFSLLLGLPRLLAVHPRRERLLRTIPFPSLLGRGALRRLYRAASVLEVADQRFDAVHCHFGHNALAILPLRRLGLLQGPMLASFHGYDINVIPRIHGSTVYHSLFQQVDLIMANSAFTAERIAALGCPAKRIVIHPMGIDLGELPFAERHYPSEGPINVLTIGRLTEVKGIVYALRALRVIIRHHASLEYVVVGDGPRREALIQEATNLGLGNNVRFVGWKTRDELYPIFARAHLFLLPSVTASRGDVEGQGVVLQEAQASGIPVIATRHGGFPDSVPAEVSRLLVDERDVDGLADRLLGLLEHPEEWAAIGRRGRRFVEDRFDINKLNDQLEQLYRQLGTS